MIPYSSTVLGLSKQDIYISLGFAVTVVAADADDCDDDCGLAAVPSAVVAAAAADDDDGPDAAAAADDDDGPDAAAAAADDDVGPDAVESVVVCATTAGVPLKLRVVWSSYACVLALTVSRV